MKEKTKRILVVVVKWRHRANGLLEFQLVFRVSSQNTWTDRPIGRLVGLLEEQLSFLTLFYLDWCRKHLPHYISLKWVLLGCNSPGQFFITSWRALNNFAFISWLTSIVSRLKERRTDVARRQRRVGSVVLAAQSWRKWQRISRVIRKRNRGRKTSKTLQ